jgi:hypothetical protein
MQLKWENEVCVGKEKRKNQEKEGRIKKGKRDAKAKKQRETEERKAYW